MEVDFDEEYDPRDENPDLVCIQCPKCCGSGFYDCRCGGDLCFCGAGETDCYFCDQTGSVYITKEENENRIKLHKELMVAIWGEKP